MKHGLSFIIPAYNEEKNIAKCISSIHYEMIAHEDLPYQIIVVDNNSTDNTAQVSLEKGAEVYIELEKGVVFARNTGSRVAKYRYLANIDADNHIPEGWVTIARANMENYAAISGPLKYDDVPGYFNVGTNVFYFFAKILHRWFAPTIQGGNYILDKEVWTKMGGYDTSFEFYGEDTNTARMVKKFGEIKLVSEMWIHSSPRRIQGQGLLKTMYLYITSYFAAGFGKKSTSKYEDFR